jgi:hypothetical protein
MRLGPDTTNVVLGEQVWFEFDHFAGYHHNDTHIRAISHT